MKFFSGLFFKVFKIIRFLFAPFFMLANVFFKFKKVGGGLKYDLSKADPIERPENWKELYHCYAKGTRLSWYVTIFMPCVLIVVQDKLGFIFYYSLVMFLLCGVVISLNMALKAQQLRTGDRIKSDPRHAFRDGWWWPQI